MKWISLLFLNQWRRNLGNRITLCKLSMISNQNDFLFAWGEVIERFWQEQGVFNPILSALHDQCALSFGLWILLWGTKLQIQLLLNYHYLYVCSVYHYSWLAVADNGRHATWVPESSLHDFVGDEVEPGIPRMSRRQDRWKASGHWQTPRLAGFEASWRCVCLSDSNLQSLESCDPW